MNIRIYYLLLPKVHILDVAGSVQVFYEANQLGNNTFKLSFLSISDEIESEQGLWFQKLQKFDTVELTNRDYLIIPGIDFTAFSNGLIDEAIATTKPWILKQYEKGVNIGSVCTGALVLGKIGLLNKSKFTTHWKSFSYAYKQFPKANLMQDRLYVFDNNLFTSAGMTTGIDMSLALVEKITNPLLAAKVAKEMVINVRRSETQNQENTFLDFKNNFSELVYKIHEKFESELSVKYTLKHLASEMNISERHLSRVFKDFTQQTIQSYRDSVRFQLATQLLTNTRLSIKEIAIKCGFENQRQFSRLWSKFEQMTPSLWRNLH